MHCTQAVAIVISSELAPPMIDTLMLVSPDMQARINAVLVCKNKRTRHDGVFDQGLDGLLLHVGQEMDDHLTATLQHPKDGRSFLLHRASSTFTFASASTAFAPLALDDFGVPFMAGYHIGFITLHLVGEDHGWLFFQQSGKKLIHR